MRNEPPSSSSAFFSPPSAPRPYSSQRDAASSRTRHSAGDHNRRKCFGVSCCGVAVEHASYAAERMYDGLLSRSLYFASGADRSYQPRSSLLSYRASRIGTTSTTNASAPFRLHSSNASSPRPPPTSRMGAPDPTHSAPNVSIKKRRKCPHRPFLLTRRLVRAGETAESRRRTPALSETPGDAPSASGGCANRHVSPYRHPPRLQCRHTGGARTGGPGAPGAHASAGIARDRRARRRLSTRPRNERGLLFNASSDTAIDR